MQCMVSAYRNSFRWEYIQKNTKGLQQQMNKKVDVFITKYHQKKSDQQMYYSLQNELICQLLFTEEGKEGKKKKSTQQNRMESLPNIQLIADMKKKKYI